MMFISRYLLLGSLLMPCFGVMTLAAKADDICSGITAYMSRDYTNITRKNSVSKNIYDSHCQDSSYKSDSTTTIGLDAVIEAIPVGFDLGVGSSEAKMDSFCKQYKSNENTIINEGFDSSIVVREALKSFNDCVKATRKEIFFYPQIAKTMIQVDVRRGSPDASVLGVIYDHSKLSCTVPYSDTDKTRVIADSNTTMTLTGNQYPINCERIKSTMSDGTEKYATGELAINTTLATLIIPFEGDSILPFDTTKEINRELKRQEIEISALKNKNYHIECKSSSSDFNTTVTSGSIFGGMNSSTAYIPPSDWDMGFRITGGGCQTREVDISNSQYKSAPLGDRGWICEVENLQVGDSTLRKVGTWIQYCRLSE